MRLAGADGDVSRQAQPSELPSARDAQTAPEESPGSAAVDRLLESHLRDFGRAAAAQPLQLRRVRKLHGLARRVVGEARDGTLRNSIDAGEGPGEQNAAIGLQGETVDGAIRAASPGVERRVQAAIWIQSGEVVHDGPVEVEKGSSKQDLSIGLDGEGFHGAVGAAAGRIEGRIDTPIGIEPDQIAAGRSVEAGEAAAGEDLAIRLQGHARDTAGDARARIEAGGRFRRSIGIEPRDPGQRHSIHHREISAHHDLPIGLHGDAVHDSICPEGGIERAIYGAVAIQPGDIHGCGGKNGGGCQWNFTPDRLEAAAEEDLAVRLKGEASDEARDPVARIEGGGLASRLPVRIEPGDPCCTACRRCSENSPPRRIWPLACTAMAKTSARWLQRPQFPRRPDWKVESSRAVCVETDEIAFAVEATVAVPLIFCPPAPEKLPPSRILPSG